MLVRVGGVIVWSPDPSPSYSPSPKRSPNPNPNPNPNPIPNPEPNPYPNPIPNPIPNPSQVTDWAGPTAWFLYAPTAAFYCIIAGVIWLAVKVVRDIEA